MAEKGSDTDRHHPIATSFNGIEMKQMERIRKHYKFESNQDVIRALLKRAFMSLPKESVK